MRVVRVSAESVVLDLAAPAGAAIAPFVAADDTRWVLSPALLAAELPDRPRALAGLVTLGFAGAETVLLNLESVGTLAVTGSSEATRDVLRGLAADLAFGPCSALTERTLCMGDPTISEAVEAGGIGVERDPVRAAAALRLRSWPRVSWTGCRARRTGCRSGGPARRRRASGDPLLIVLCDQDLDLRVPPRSGCALITTVPVVGAGATLVVDDSGAGVLLPEREHLTAQFLSRTATRDIVEALSAADLPEAGLDSTDVPGADPSTERPVGTDEPTAGQAGLWESPPTSSGVIDLRESSTMSGAAGDPRWAEEQRLLPLGLDPVGPLSQSAAVTGAARAGSR